MRGILAFLGLIFIILIIVVGGVSELAHQRKRIEYLEMKAMK